VHDKLSLFCLHYSMSTQQRIIFFISDSTGITVEKLGQSLLSQFPDIDFQRVSLRYVDSVDKVAKAREEIEAAAKNSGKPPIVFSTLAQPALREALKTDAAVVLDMFGIFLDLLEAPLQQKASHAAGHAHRMAEPGAYMARMDAVNYALRYDDGLGDQDYGRADVILLGVSRSGKTPVCLYLAMQYGLFAANYPLVEEDLQTTALPSVLQPFRPKLFGLTIEPQRLQKIRARRYSGRDYADLGQCRREVARAEALFAASQLPVLDTTVVSVEEIATQILAQMQMNP